MAEKCLCMRLGITVIHLVIAGGKDTRAERFDIFGGQWCGHIAGGKNTNRQTTRKLPVCPSFCFTLSLLSAKGRYPKTRDKTNFIWTKKKLVIGTIIVQEVLISQFPRWPCGFYSDQEGFLYKTLGMKISDWLLRL